MFARGEHTCIFAKPPLLYLSLKAVGQPAVTAVYITKSEEEGGREEVRERERKKEREREREREINELSN